jgi:uncharacterized Zn-binding protein involved in type VI secretion
MAGPAPPRKAKTPEEIAQDKATAAFKAALPAPGPTFAARVGDPHLCPMLTALVPHFGGPILPPGCPTALIGGQPAARVGDMATCTGPPDVIAKGSMTVVIGGMPAARVMDQTAHGGMIVMGCSTVIIGDQGMGDAGCARSAFQLAAEQGSPLVCKGPCEACGALY